MDAFRRVCFAIITVVVAVRLGTCHKAQFRVLGLQYGTLYQRFELENKLLRGEMDIAKLEIRDLKADNGRIIQMFEVFTEEVRDLKETLLTETLKLKSLETEFKTLHGQYEDFKLKLTKYEENNNTVRKGDDVHCSGNKCNRDVKTVHSVNVEDSDKSSSAEVKVTSAGEDGGRSDAYLFAAKYGESKACFVNLHNMTVSHCVSHLGEGVRVVTSDRQRLYWSDDNKKLIMSSDFNVSDVQIITDANPTTLGLAVDSLHHVLFYTNISGDIFRKTLTDPYDKGSLWTNIAEKPRRIFVDTKNKLIYAITNRWSGIVRINYSTNQRQLIVEAQGRVKALVVDVKNQILYFSVNSTVYLKYLGNKATYRIFEGSAIPSDLVIHGHYMYIGYYYLNKVDVMDLKTRDITHTIYLPWRGNGNTVSLCLIHGNI